MRNNSAGVHLLFLCEPVLRSKLSAHVCICAAVPVDWQVDYHRPAFSLGRIDQDQEYGAVA